MPAYNIGGSYVISGYGMFEGDLYLGNHDMAGWSRLGTECSFGVPMDGRMCDMLIEANAFDSGYSSYPPMTPTDCLWIATAQSVTGETVYYGVQGFGGSVDNHAVVLTLTLFASDSPSLEGTFVSVGTFSQSVYNYAVTDRTWFMYYVDTNGKPYLGGFSGQPLNVDRPDTYSEASEHIAENPENWSVNGGIPLTSATGEDLELAIEPDESFPSGGGGDYDNDSDVIPWAGLPTLGAFNSGFLAVYNPSESEIQQFASYLWGKASDIWDNIMKYQANVMDLIVSLAVIPVEPPLGNLAPIKIGGVSSGVSSYLISNQYMAFDCGTFAVNEYYGNALDYGGYSRVHLFLPYVGVIELKTDEVMGGSVAVRYNIDLVSGSCVAMVRCNRQGLNAVLYQFEGNVSMQIPLVSRDFMGMYQTIVNGSLGAIGGGASTVGAVAGGGGIAGGIASGTSALQSAISVMSAKPNVQHAGSLSSNGGHLGIHKPYLIIERPIQSYPANARMFYGAPSNVTSKLGNVKGYTEVEEVILDGIGCTDEELELIRNALSEGTIL